MCSFKITRKGYKWGEEAFVDFKSYLREVCSLYFTLNPVILGGEGRIVQIYESCFAKGKKNVGRLLPTQWGFGGVYCTTKECFLVPVQHRNADTLIPIIRDYVQAGTIIYSDLWRAISTLEHEGFNHLSVNQKLNFFGPNKGANTQRAEILWIRSMRRNKKECGTARHLLHSYLIEFMWREYSGHQHLKVVLVKVKIGGILFWKDFWRGKNPPKIKI